MGACTNLASTTGITYNEGLAESYNSVLLMNIIRSAKSYPLYYSALGDYSADYSTDFDIDPSVDIPLQFGAGALIDGDVDVSIGPSASTSRDYNANASSLETEEFIAAMNTRLPVKTLFFFTEGRNRNTLGLILMLLIDRVAITQNERHMTFSVAKSTCLTQGHKLSVVKRGMCKKLLNYRAPSNCERHSQILLSAAIVGVANDPSNICEFSSFKHIVTAIVIADPRIVLSEDGGINFVIDPIRTNLALFKKEKTGILLRSPHETIAYLGSIVKQSYLGLDDDLLTLAAPDGKEVPIIDVREGSGGSEAAVSARVDGETYWVEKQSLRKWESHYTLAAMSVVKDIISLNTSSSQLPASSTRLIVE